MKVTLEFLRNEFARFNGEIFGARLPEPDFSISDTKSALGQFVVRAGRGEIRVTGRFEMERRQLEDVLIHEMIHYFIYWSGLTDTSAHGAAFKGLMLAINAAHGRDIRVSARLTESQRTQAARHNRRERVICVVGLADGRIGVKVLPKADERIREFRRKIGRAANVASVEFYCHDNPFFGRFPTSTSLRCHILQESEIRSNLQGARRLKC